MPDSAFSTPYMDTSIPGQAGGGSGGPSAGPLSTISNVMNLKYMMERGPMLDLEYKNQALDYGSSMNMRKALQTNTDPNTGAPNFGAAYQQLGKMGDPVAQAKLVGVQQGQEAKSLEIQNQKAQLANTQQEIIKGKMANVQNKANLAATLAGSVTDDDSLARAKAMGAQYGLDVSKLPDKYDEAKPELQQIQGLGMTSQQQLQTKLESTKQQQTMSEDYYKDYSKDKRSDQFKEITSAAGAVQAGLQSYYETKTSNAPQKEQGLALKGAIIGIVRMDNPTMGARVSTMSDMEAAQSLPSELQAMGTKWAQGQMLSDAQIKALEDYARIRFNSARVAQTVGPDSEYTTRSTKDLHIIPDPGTLLGNPKNSPNPFDSIAKTKQQISALEQNSPDGPSPEASPAASEPVKVGTPDQHKALSSGALYVAPDGSTRRKK